MLAIQCDYVTAALRLVAASEADVINKGRDSDGMTALMLAVEKSHVTIVEKLITDSKIDTSKTNTSGNTALMLTKQHLPEKADYLNIMNTLYAHEKNIVKVALDSEKASSIPSESLKAAFEYAIITHDLQLIKDIIALNRADITIQDYLDCLDYTHTYHSACDDYKLPHEVDSYDNDTEILLILTGVNTSTITSDDEIDTAKCAAINFYWKRIKDKVSDKARLKFASIDNLFDELEEKDRNRYDYW